MILAGTVLDELERATEHGLGDAGVSAGMGTATITSAFEPTENGTMADYKNFTRSRIDPRHLDHRHAGAFHERLHRRGDG